MEYGSDLNSPITRRRALRDLGAAGLGLAALGTGIEDLLARAAAASPKTGTLRDIEHVVILIQENRSFDHYFGTLSGVRGFDDKNGRNHFFQRDPSGKKLHPLPMRLRQLPDGAMLQSGSESYLVLQGRPLLWSAGGYREAPNKLESVMLLTPPSTLRALSAGYRPVLHPYAVALGGERALRHGGVEN